MRLYTRYEPAHTAPQTQVLSITGVEPVDVIKAKAFIRENSDLDAEQEQIIDDLITQCREAIEKELGISIIEKSIRIQWRTYGSVVELPDGPHGDVSNVKRIFKGVSEDLTEGVDYYVEGLEYKRLAVNNKFSVSGGQGYNLQCDVVSGYNGATVPGPIRLALLKTILSHYEYREEFGEQSIAELPNDAKSLLKDYKRKVWL